MVSSTSQQYKIIPQRKPPYLYPWSGPIPVQSVRGKPREMGLQIGRHNNELISKTVRETWGFLEEVLKLTKQEISEDLDQYGKKIKGCHYSFASEMEGVADGADVGYNDIVLLNSHINILSMRGGERGLPALLCSSFAAWGSATLDGSLVLGHNDDGIRFTDQFLILLDARPEEGRHFCSPVIPGYLGYHTVVNDAGLCVVGNALENGPKPEESRVGVPMWTIFRYLAQFVDSVESAIDFIRKVDNGIAGSFLIAEKSGKAAIVHRTPSHIALVHPDAGKSYLALTNHALDDEIRRHLMERPKPSNTYYRLESIVKAIEKHLGKIDADRAMEIMSTHYDSSIGRENPSGNTPCRHYEYEGKFAGTCRSAVVNFSQESAKIFVTLGNPCTGSWVELDLDYA